MQGPDARPHRRSIPESFLKKQHQFLRRYRKVSPSLTLHRCRPSAQILLCKSCYAAARQMGGGVLSKSRGFIALCAALAALLAAAGCGGSGGGGVTVQTGSLSEAEFASKADAICEAARSEFLAKFESYVQSHKADITDQKKQDAVLGEILETILGPNIEAQV